MPHIFMKEGRGYMPIDRESITLMDQLPPGTYTVQATPMGYRVEAIDNFDLPARLYGDTEARARRVLNTFHARPAVTGVLLSGQKGSGKTMLAKRIAQIGLQEEGMVTFVINQPLRGEGFNTFLQNITQPAIVLFDEFEKVYDLDEQEELLTIFDGTYSSKKLFILTCNDRYKIGQYMLNRPGRIFYAMQYEGLHKDFIEEYCKDNLRNHANQRGVEAVAAHFNEFSFDMLKALVEEMNRYGETASEAMKMLNMNPHSDAKAMFDVSVLHEGRSVTSLGYSVTPESTSINPLTISPDDDICVGVIRRDSRKGRRLPKGLDSLGMGSDIEEEESGEDELFDSREYFDIKSADLESMRPVEGVFIFRTSRPEVKVVYRRRPPTTTNFHYDAL